MSEITNHYRSLNVVDLNPSLSRRGPFLVAQVGMAPDDPTCREKMFVLRRDGCWVDLAVYLSSGQPETLDEAVFPTINPVLDLIGRLSANPKVLEVPWKKESLRAWLQRNPAGTMLAQLETWLAGYRHRQTLSARRPAPPEIDSGRSRSAGTI